MTRAHVPIGSDVELAEFIDQEGGGGGVPADFAILVAAMTGDYDSLVTLAFNPGASTDPLGYLNGEAYDSPDWWGGTFAANETFILPPGAYLIDFRAGVLPGDGSVGQFQQVDNRLANDLSGIYDAVGAPYPDVYHRDGDPNALSGQFDVLVPTDYGDGVVLAATVRIIGTTHATDVTARIGIRKIG